MGLITDAEFLLLYEESRSDNLDSAKRVSDIFFAGQKWSRVYRQFKGREASHNYVKIFDVFISEAVVARRKTEISVTEMRIVPYEHSSPVNRDETF